MSVPARAVEGDERARRENLRQLDGLPPRTFQIRISLGHAGAGTMLARDERTLSLQTSNVRGKIDPIAYELELEMEESGLILARQNLVENAANHSLDQRRDRIGIAVLDEASGIPDDEIAVVRDRIVRGRS